MTERLPDDRAVQAARAWFAQEAAGVDPGSLDPAAIRSASDRRRWLRFSGLLAAAAVLLAVLVIVPLALRPADSPITGIPAPSASEPTWTTTAPSPLSPRFGSLTAWLDGQFYVIGGWDGGPCPPGGMCDMKGPDLRDGASYDPATDSWTTIADAPFTIGRDFASGASFQGSLYVMSVTGDGSFWAYQPGADQWQQLTMPPASGELIAVGSELVLDSWDDAARLLYNAADDTWVPLPEGPLDSCEGSSALAADERLLVVGRCAADGGVEFRTSSYDPVTGEWSQPSAIPGITAERTSYYATSYPVYAAGRLLWPGALSVVSSMWTPGIYDIESRAWREVSADGAAGGLSFRGIPGPSEPVVLETLGLVEANGNLLDVRTANWVEVPEAPVPDRWDPVTVVGPESLLSCFGYRYDGDDFSGGGFSDSCAALTIGS